MFRVFTLDVCRLDAALDFGEEIIPLRFSRCFCFISLFTDSSLFDLAGFAVTGHLDGSGRSHIFVSEVDPLGNAAREGPKTGFCLD